MDTKKPMNLLLDQWLPVKTKNGDEITIRVSELCGQMNNDIVEVISPRADFKGAIYQLLIGVLQTAFAPKDGREWKKYWRNPPSKEELEQAFKPIEPAFNLNTKNGEPAFMQDFDLPAGKEETISSLMIEVPTGSTLTNNTDHFVKRKEEELFSPYFAAIALFTLQINAPEGGRSHRVSLRGGGPLTTLVLLPKNSSKNNLWRQLWLNVLTSEEMLKLPGNQDLNELSEIFPWMAPTRISTSVKKNNRTIYIDGGQSTRPIDANPLHAYWSMPKRIRIDWKNTSSGECAINGHTYDELVKYYRIKIFGTDYIGNWLHPLTPYYLESGNEPLSIKGQPGGLSYRHWLGLAIIDDTGKAKKTPAAVVQNYSARRYQWINEQSLSPRLWAFGYDMSGMKARCWYETTMPIFNLEGEALENLQEYAQKMVQAATDVLKTLKSALKIAWFKRPKDAKGDISYIDANFWLFTETKFYDLLAQLAEQAKNDDEVAIDKLLAHWRSHLKQSAYELFDQYALSSKNEDGDFKRVIKAKHGKDGLEHYLKGSKALKALAA